MHAIHKKLAGTLLSAIVSCVPAKTKAQYADTTAMFYFPLNSAHLTAPQAVRLDSFLSHVYRIKRIVGFADISGAKFYNKKLSQQRAAAVAHRIPARADTLAGFELLGKGATDSFGSRWQNRAVLVQATIPAPVPAGATSSMVPEHKRNIEIFFDPADVKNAPIVRTLQLDNIYFIPDQPEIQPNSLQYVDDLVRTLKQMPGGFFEIVGHVNYQSRAGEGQLRDLFRLSEERARTVYELLVQKGIPARRMQYRGVGNTEPVIASPKTDAERMQNMRVEIRVHQR